MRRTRRLAAVSTTALALAAGSLTGFAGTAGAAQSGRSDIPGSQPAWANSRALRAAAPAGDTVHVRVYLPWRDDAALASLATDVSTPGSSSYRAFLTPQQFRSRFAPKQSDVAAVQRWLRDAGFTIVDTPDNGHYVAVEGTVAQAQSAFGTTLGLYAAYGQALRAPESAPSVPSSLAGVVSAVVGLDDSPLLQAPDIRRDNAPDANHGAPSTGFRVGTPCSDYYGQKTVEAPPAYGSTRKPLAVCGYTPKQVQGLYGLDQVFARGTTGAGQTVAFVGANASPTIVSDVTTYSRAHGLPDPQITQQVAPGVYRHPDTPRQTPGDFYGEETLDAEAIHTTAPGAALLFVGSSNANQDFDASVNHIVDKHLAPIVSISYGFTGEAIPRGFINSLNATFEQAAATGIGVFVSSGDDGDDATDFNGQTAVDFYADSPFVTAVGGTSAAVVPAGTTNPDASGWKRGFEVGWQTGRDVVKGGTLTGSGTTYTLSGSYASPLPGDFFGGGGGGVSRLFAQPSYQRGVTDVAADGATGRTGGRAVPDLSALADPNTGFRVGQTQAFSNGTYYDEYRIGGTSLSAPLTAGIAALANQAAGTPLGFLNPAIYRLYRSAAYYDVNKSTVDQGAVVPGSSREPAEIRVNYVNSEDASAGLAYSLRTLEEDAQTLHSTAGYDTATGVGSPQGPAFVSGLAASR